MSQAHAQPATDSSEHPATTYVNDVGEPRAPDRETHGPVPLCVSLPPPTLRERRHRCLARRRVAVRERAALMIIVRERPHPRHPHRYSGRLHDAPNHDAIAEHVEVIVAPLAGGTRS